MGRFLLEAARDEWEGKGGPIFENAEMKNLVTDLSIPNLAHGEL